MSVVDVFPKRPLQLTAYYGRPTLWYGIVTCVAIGFLGYAVYSSTVSLVDDFRLRTNGTPAIESSLTNGVCHERGINDCEYDANYTTTDGTSYTRHVEMTTFFQEVDQQMRFTVRYDPASPNHISTSWGVGLMVNRTITTFLGWLLMLGFLAYAVSLVVGPRRLRRKMAAIGAQPTPVEVTFLKAFANPRAPVVTLSYSWTSAAGLPMKSSTELRGAREPFWLDAKKTRMLALIGPDGQSQLLDEKLALVSLTELERARVVEERNRTFNVAVLS